MFSMINIMGLVATVGLDSGVVRYTSMLTGEGRYGETRKILSAAVMLGVGISIIVTVAIIILASWLSAIFLDGSIPAVILVQIFAISIPFWVAARLFNAATQGVHRMQYQVYSRDIGEQVLKFVFSIVAIAAGAGLAGVVWANVASVVIAMGMSLWFVIQVLPGMKGRVRVRRIEDEPGLAGRMLRYSFPLAFSNIFGMVLLYTDLLLLGYLGTATDAGYYGTALRLITGSQAILLAFATVFTPVIADLYNRGCKSELQSLFKTVGRWIFMCNLPIFLILVLFADSVMHLFGSNFGAGSGALIVLVLGQLVNFGTGTAGLMVLMSGHSRMELFNVSTSLLFNIVLCFILIPSYGIIGAAIANAIGIGVINVMRALEVWIIMRMHAYDFQYLKPALAGLGAALLVLLEKRFINHGLGLAPLASSIVALLISYTLLTFVLGVNEQDRTVLQLIKSRLARSNLPDEINEQTE